MSRDEYVRIKRKVVLFCICLALSSSFALIVDYHYVPVLAHGLSMYKTLGTLSVALLKRYHFENYKDIEDIKVGDLVDIRMTDGDKILHIVKRVVAKQGDKIWVRGEHPFSYDSRYYGWVSVFQVYGKVIHYIVIRKPSQEELHKIELEAIRAHQMNFPYPDLPQNMD
jgi:hypothetical protein